MRYREAQSSLLKKEKDFFDNIGYWPNLEEKLGYFLIASLYLLTLTNAYDAKP